MEPPASNLYYEHYARQIGGGAYYQSRYSVQRGRGWLGRFMKNALRYLRPLASHAARAVGQEAIRQGSNVIHDVITEPSQPLQTIVKRRGREGLGNLATRAAKALTGGGRRRGRGAERDPTQPCAKRPRHQTGSGPRPVRTAAGATAARKRRTSKKTPAPRHSVPALRDIFGPPP